MKAPATAENGGADVKAKQQTADAYHKARPSRPQVPAQKQPPPSPAPTVDLAALRERLVGVRRRLLERLAADWSDDRRFPDSAWTKLLGDVHGAIQALNAQVADDGSAP